MKKFIVIISLPVLASVLTVSFLMCSFMDTIPDPQNVYEEIWNMVSTEQHTKKSTPLTSTEESFVDFDFGIDFVGIIIPECNVTVGWWNVEGTKELSFLFWLEKGEYVHFLYNRQSKTLFGDRALSYLMDNFLADYFKWCKAADGFSVSFSEDDPGDFLFRYSEDPINDRD